MGRIRNVRLGILLNVGMAFVFIIAAVIVIVTVNNSMRQQALVEAESKARIILDRNLATHTYFSQIMKPSIFAWSEPFRSKDYFDHTWMSSTYAIREIEKFFKALNPSGYAFKDSAIDARSPENEADEHERLFLEKLRAGGGSEAESAIRDIDGKPYLVVLRKGEVMEASCLRCHSDPAIAPKGMTDYYGTERSFHRKEGETSIVSLRIPLAESFVAANAFSWKLSTILLVVLAGLFAVQFWLYRRYLLKPLNLIRAKAEEIATGEGRLGEQIPPLFGREISELTATFNAMSLKLRHDRDHLEELVNKQTVELRESEQKFRELSMVDDLTQLYNSRHFYHQLRMEMERAERYRQPLTLLLIDLDDFKRFNDLYGHVEGDQLLFRFGQMVKRCLRQTDSAYRYGGEEFTVILPMTTGRDGVVTAERIRAELRKETFSPVAGQEVRLTVSIGLGQYRPQEEMKAFVHRVDQRMYQAKMDGKDRICSAS